MSKIYISLGVIIIMALLMMYSIWYSIKNAYDVKTPISFVNARTKQMHIGYFRTQLDETHIQVYAPYLSKFVKLEFRNNNWFLCE